jgi:hypothetical protein
MDKQPRRATDWSKVIVNAGLGMVSVVAGVVSYYHMIETIHRWTAEVTILSYIVPLSVDGLMMVSAVQYKMNRGRSWRYRFWPALATFVSLSVSGAANAVASDFSGPVAIGESIWPVAALFLALQSIKEKLVKPNNPGQYGQKGRTPPTPQKSTKPPRPTAKGPRVTNTKPPGGAPMRKHTNSPIAPDFVEANI